jgi:HEAT repeat protein
MTVALREIRGEPAAEALGRLVRNDPDAHTRVMAVSALGRFESRGRMAVLEAALADSAPEVRAACSTLSATRRPWRTSWAR